MSVHVLIAAAELDPLVKVGGLGEATAGLARCLDLLGARVDVVIPDYPVEFSHHLEWTVPVPEWAGGQAQVRSGYLDDIGEIHAVSVPGIQRPHPYNDPANGHDGWLDNDRRFYAFGAAVAAVAHELEVEVLHLNDWHTASAVAWFPPERTMLSIHNLAHQGDADLGWLPAFGDRARAFEHLGRCNPLAAAIRLCRRVVTVSPGYAREVMTPAFGCGLEGELAARADPLVGIRNGLDQQLWNPAEDRYLPANFSFGDLQGKAVCRKELLHRTGLEETPAPVVGMVTRFVDQKGIDLVLELVSFLSTVPAVLVVHGTGDRALINAARRVASMSPAHMRVADGYREDFAHLVVAGSDLMFVPSRFEPCGLTQMQAMTCGTIPVVTEVGGLADTVIDTDRHPGRGTGFVASTPSVPALLDALHRACRGWRNRRRRNAVQRRGMTTDWTWHKPGQQYLEIYRDLAALTARSTPRPQRPSQSSQRAVDVEPRHLVHLESGPVPNESPPAARRADDVRPAVAQARSA